MGLLLMLLVPLVRRLVSRLVPPGTGPSRDVRENGSFTVRAVGVAKHKVAPSSARTVQTPPRRLTGSGGHGRPWAPHRARRSSAR